MFLNDQPFLQAVFFLSFEQLEFELIPFGLLTNNKSIHLFKFF